MFYYFKCQTRTGDEIYVFGLVAGRKLTDGLCFIPKPAWSIEAHANTEIRSLCRENGDDWTIQFYNERMIVLFTAEQARLAYLQAEVAAKTDARLDETKLEARLLRGYDDAEGILYEKKVYADLAALTPPQQNVSAKSLASWAHNGRPPATI